MKNIVIAAGYATRLYPLTENFPKQLLKFGESTILGRLLEDIDTIEDINEHIIVTNHKFVHHFEDWKSNIETKNPIRIIDDGTISNETRLGAVRDLLLAIEDCNIDEDILVIAADNILDFSFRDFVDFAKFKNTSVIMHHQELELKKLQRTGVIAIDDNNKVQEMQEKPEIPVSNWAVPPFYFYNKADMPIIKTCIENGCGFDAPGNLAHFLCDKSTIHSWEMTGKRHDIGTLESYYEAQDLFQ